jgi:hypothetical protein
MIVSGQAFEKKHYKGLAESYKNLEYALKLLKIEDFGAWLGLLSPYLGDPADPAIVEDWREKSEDQWVRIRTGWKRTKRGYVSARRWTERHDRAIRGLAEYLKHKDLYVAWPSRMSSYQDRNHMEAMNAELYNVYRTARLEGVERGKAIKDAAAVTGYSVRRAQEIIKLREGEEKSVGDARGDRSTNAVVEAARGR